MPTLQTALIAITVSLLFRFFWRIFLDNDLPLLREIISLVLILIVLWVRSQPQPPAVPTTIPAINQPDSLRNQLSRQADSSARISDQLHQQNQPAKTSYENAKRAYDSVQVSLP